MSKVLFNILFVCGLLIIWSGYYLVVPLENRSAVSLLNTGIITVIYLSYWFKYSVIFPNRRDSGTFLAGAGVYWFAQGFYVFISVLCMIAGWYFKWGFKVQLLLAMISLFIFAVYITGAVFTVEHISRCSPRDDLLIRDVREIQRTVALVSAIAQALDPDWIEVKKQVQILEEDLSFIIGINNSEASKIDEQILHKLNNLKNAVSDAQNIEMTQNIINEIHVLIRQRKILKNIG